MGRKYFKTLRVTWTFVLRLLKPEEWSQLSGSNRRPTVYKTVALPLS
jgi:hypothetical protein